MGSLFPPTLRVLWGFGLGGSVPPDIVINDLTVLSCVPAPMAQRFEA